MCVSSSGRRGWIHLCAQLSLPLGNTLKLKTVNLYTKPLLLMSHRVLQDRFAWIAAEADGIMHAMQSLNSNNYLHSVMECKRDYEMLAHWRTLQMTRPSQSACAC